MSLSTPQTPIFARPWGTLQWVCPNCENILSRVYINIRRSRVRCNHCNKRYRVGIGFHTAQVEPNVPLIHLSDPRFLNVIGLPDSDITVKARLRGPIEYQCPQCRTVQPSSQGATWEGGMKCPTCEAVFYIYPIFYHGTTHRLITAWDWTPPYASFQPFSPPAFRQVQ